MECRAAICIIDISQLLQLFVDIGIITCTGSGVTSRVYARFSAKGVDYEARVVGNRWQSGSNGRMPRFDDRICGKRVPILNRITDSKIRLRNNGNVEIHENA